MSKDVVDDYFYWFGQNLLWGFLDGGFSMFYSLSNFFWWIVGALINAFLWID